MGQAFTCALHCRFTLRVESWTPRNATSLAFLIRRLLQIRQLAHLLGASTSELRVNEYASPSDLAGHAFRIFNSIKDYRECYPLISAACIVDIAHWTVQIKRQLPVCVKFGRAGDYRAMDNQTHRQQYRTACDSVTDIPSHSTSIDIIESTIPTIEFCKTRVLFEAANMPLE